MDLVDTHCHAGESWFEPVEALVHQMDANGVDNAVLIQHRGVFDNAYLLGCVERFPGRFAVAGMVDISNAGAETALERLAGQGAIAVRLNAGDPERMFRKASELGLIVSCQGETQRFASGEFRDTVEGLPDLVLVVEHLAGGGPSEAAPYSTFRRAMELSKLPNTYIKVGGLGEIAERPAVLAPEFGFPSTPPLIDIATETFGPRRMMWGSDFPPVSGREGYRNALRGVADYPALSDAEDKAWVMGKTALSVFRFI